ncbi:MAG TPA: cytochrome c [Terriglobales bacterium]|jgi:mono/diheme cytochrome c family protein|nr:cytochrome c [Terriglobales bacterium]
MKTKYFGWAVVVVMGLIVAKTWAWQGADLSASIDRGKAVYSTTCITCHRDAGQGIPEVYPPLAKSDYLMANKTRSIGIVVNGLTGPVTVNKVKYDSEMVPVDLTDEQVADVLTFVRNSWGNKGPAVKTAEVAPTRKK